MKVYPAYAGVILVEEEIDDPINSLSRIRGGDPNTRLSEGWGVEFIPHTRG